MHEIAAVKEQIDRQARPGQRGAATSGNRVPGASVIALGRTVAQNVYHPASGTESRFGLYGRARYGEGRYVEVR